MKKLIGLLLAVVMCLSFAACGGNKLEGLQKEIYDAADEIGCKEVTAGYEYNFPDFDMKDGSKQEVDLLLLIADGNPYIVDREDGKVYAEKDVPQDFEVENNSAVLVDKEDIFSLLIYFEEMIANYGMVWADYETLKPIGSEDLKAVNAALK